MFFLSALIAFTCSLSAASPADFIPAPEQSDPYAGFGKRIPLAGWWKLKKVSSDRKDHPDDPGTLQKYYAPETDDSGWDKDLVPNNLHTPFLKLKPSREERLWGGVAWFRKALSLPALEKGERAILQFKEIRGNFTVYVNGQKVGKGTWNMPSGFGEYKGYSDPHVFDVTPFLRPGKNILALRFFHSGEKVLWGNWSPVLGITGNVALEIHPAAWAEQILVTTAPERKSVSVEALIEGSGKPEDVSGWTGRVFEWNSRKKMADVNFSTEKRKDMFRTVSASFPVRHGFNLWSPESPFLYGIEIRNRAGKTVGIQRFGIRTFESKNGNFLLNGIPFQVRGMCGGDGYPEQTHGAVYALNTNDGGGLKNYWKQFREMGFNTIRLKEYAPEAYHVFDELGMLVTDELTYPSIRIENPERADWIDIKGYDTASDEKGELKSEFRTRTVNRMHRLYSHPSICMYSFGNELRDYSPRVTWMLNNLYDLYRATDRQKRPITSSSGRFWKAGNNVEELCRSEKMDFVDTHDYTGSISNFPVTCVRPVAEHFTALVRRHFPGGMAPVVNGETVYFVHHYAAGIMDPVWRRESDSEPNWPRALFVLNDWTKKNRSHAMLGLYWVRNWGMKNYKYRQNAGRGFYAEKILEAQRLCWPELDGYNALSGPYFKDPATFYPFDKVRFEPNEAYEAIRRVNAPIFAATDQLPPNQYAGEELKTNLHVFNHSETRRDGLTAEVFLEKNGKRIGSAQTFQLPAMNPGDRKIEKVLLSLPDSEGSHRLVFRVAEKGAERSRRFTELNLRKRDPLFRPIQTDKKIALYDAASVFKGLTDRSTALLLKAYKLKFSEIRSFETLDQYDLLVIGSVSIDERIRENADRIETYLRNGGRILVLDQNISGRIPFLPELEYGLAGPGQFTEILQFRHPAMNGMRQNDFSIWNQKDGAVYHHFIRPVSECALSVGGDTSQWGADNFGMITAHLKAGKGDVLLTQAELLQTFDKDSGAAQFTRNLLRTVLDDSTRSAARAYRGYPVKFRPPAGKNSVPISLKSAANRSYADKVANDGKDGWSDQGPMNDFALLPHGKQIFGGIPFELINPTENGDRSCVVVSSHKDRIYCPESRPIPLGIKAKRLFFLHTGAYTGKGNVVDYIITWADGSRTVLPLTAGEQISDWWNAPSKELKQAGCVWSCSNPSGVVGLYAWEWKNPTPGKAIRSIVLRAKNPSVIGLFALTAETN